MASPEVGFSEENSLPHQRSNLSRKLAQSNGMTGLMYACQKGKIEEVQRIIRKKKQSIRERSRNGRFPLHYCAERGDMECLEYVLEADRSLINEQDEEGYTPLHLAVISGNHDAVKSLISSGGNVHICDRENHSLTHWAAVCGELDILETLLSCGCPVSTSDIHSAHPIHYAAQMCGKGHIPMTISPARVQSTVYGSNPQKGIAVLRRLIEHGAQVNVMDKDGREPLLWAASAGSSDAILTLVNAGANVGSSDKDGLTALHCAASRGHTDCIEALIGLCGSEVDIIDNNGCTALFYAVTLGHADAAEMLLNFGSEPNRQDRKGRTPAHCGAIQGQLETLRLLEKHEGNLWIRNVRGDLPLHDAILSRRKDLVMWLLSLNPEAINMANSSGKTPLHLAALNNNVEMVKILIDYRADINALMRTSKGISMTPLDAAVHRGNSAVAKLLGLHGGLAYTSLNDSATQRRLNRTLESRNESRMDATSRLMTHGEGRTLISPDLFPDDPTRSAQGMTSTPIPGDEGWALSSSSIEPSDFFVPSLEREGGNEVVEEMDAEDMAPTATEETVPDPGEKESDGNVVVAAGRDSSGPASGLITPKIRISPVVGKRDISESYYSESFDVPNDETFGEDPHLVDAASADPREVIENAIVKLEGLALPGSEGLLGAGSMRVDKSSQPSRLPSMAPSMAPSMQPSKAPSKLPSRIPSGKGVRKQGSDESDKMGRELSVDDYDESGYAVKIHRASTVETQESQDQDQESPKNADGSLGDSSEAPKQPTTGGAKSKFLSRIGSIRATESDESPETSPKGGQSKESSPEKSKSKSPSRVGSAGKKDSPSHLSTSNEQSPEKGSVSKSSSKSPSKATSRVGSATKKSTSSSPSKVPSKQSSRVTSRVGSASKEKGGSPQKSPTRSRAGSIGKKSSNSSRVGSGDKEEVAKHGRGKGSVGSGEGKPQDEEDEEIAAVFSRDDSGGAAEEDGKLTTPPVPKHEIPRTPPAPPPPLAYEDPDEVRKSFRSPIQREVEHLEKFATYKKVENQSAKGPRIPEATRGSGARKGREVRKKSLTKTKPQQVERQHSSESGGDSRNASAGRAERKRHETVVIKARQAELESQIEQEIDLEEEEGANAEVQSNGSGSLASSLDLQAGKKDPGRTRRGGKTSRINFSENEEIKAIESRLGHRPSKKGQSSDVDTPVSVTQAMQMSMRKYHLERKIFQELLELKRLQIRAGKSNEQVLVKRLSDSYKKAGLSINFREYNGPFTFRSFEKYLYDQLRLLQANRRLLPRFAPSDDLEKLSSALKKMNATKLPFLDDPDRSESTCGRSCSQKTHRCHHAAHSYTGVPCAAYIGRGRKSGFLPPVDPMRAPGPLDRDSRQSGMFISGRPSAMKLALTPGREDTTSPITLEVQQGSKSQIFNLPSQSLDPNRNYYVSLSIKPHPPGGGGGGSRAGLSVSPAPTKDDRNFDDGSISAPPPPVDTNYINAERDKHNVSL